MEENTVVPSGEVWAGNPAKKLRELKPHEREHLQQLPGKYTSMAAQHEEVRMTTVETQTALPSLLLCASFNLLPSLCICPTGDVFAQNEARRVHLITMGIHLTGSVLHAQLLLVCLA